MVFLRSKWHPGVTGGVINTEKIANKIRWRVCKWHPNLSPLRLQLSHLSSPISKNGTDTSKTMASIPLPSLNQNGLYQPAHSAAANRISTRLNARGFSSSSSSPICRCLPQPTTSIIWYTCTTGRHPPQTQPSHSQQPPPHLGTHYVIILLLWETWYQLQMMPLSINVKLHIITKNYSWY